MVTVLYQRLNIFQMVNFLSDNLPKSEIFKIVRNFCEGFDKVSSSTLRT